MSIERYIIKSRNVLKKEPNIRSVITFVSPALTVKVTRQKRTRANAKQKTYLISEGSPNFLERRMLKAGKINKFPLVKTEAFTNA
jgi:hypothetical protein